MYEERAITRCGMHFHPQRLMRNTVTVFDKVQGKSIILSYLLCSNELEKNNIDDLQREHSMV